MKNLYLTPLMPCTPHRGYVKIRSQWRYVTSNLHARINRRVGLKLQSIPHTNNYTITVNKQSIEGNN